MTVAPDKILCRTPTPGKAPTSIDGWKFDLVRGAILAALANGPVLFKDLPDMVRNRLTRDALARLGSIMWYVTTVKLELEVRGEVVRAPGKGPQRLERPSS